MMALLVPFGSRTTNSPYKSTQGTTPSSKRPPPSSADAIEDAPGGATTAV